MTTDFSSDIMEAVCKVQEEKETINLEFFIHWKYPIKTDSEIDIFR